MVILNNTFARVTASIRSKLMQHEKKSEIESKSAWDGDGQSIPVGPMLKVLLHGNAVLAIVTCSVYVKEVNSSAKRAMRSGDLARIVSTPFRACAFKAVEYAEKLFGTGKREVVDIAGIRIDKS